MLIFRMMLRNDESISGPDINTSAKPSQIRANQQVPLNHCPFASCFGNSGFSVSILMIALARVCHNSVLCIATYSLLYWHWWLHPDNCYADRTSCSGVLGWHTALAAHLPYAKRPWMLHDPIHIVQTMDESTDSLAERCFLCFWKSL